MKTVQKLENHLCHQYHLPDHDCNDLYDLEINFNKHRKIYVKIILVNKIITYYQNNLCLHHVPIVEQIQPFA